MEAVRQWGFSLCAAMVACGIARMILPASNLEKMFRMVVSVFFICAILSPVALRTPGLLAEMTPPNEAEIARRSDRVDEVANRQAMEAIRADVEKAIADYLSQRGINVQAVAINITTDGQNTVRLESADLLLASEHQGELEVLRSRLESELGCRVSVRC